MHWDICHPIPLLGENERWVHSLTCIPVVSACMGLGSMGAREVSGRPGSCRSTVNSQLCQQWCKQNQASVSVSRRGEKTKTQSCSGTPDSPKCHRQHPSTNTSLSRTSLRSTALPSTEALLIILKCKEVTDNTQIPGFIFHWTLCKQLSRLASSKKHWKLHDAF